MPAKILTFFFSFIQALSTMYRYFVSMRPAHLELTGVILVISTTDLNNPTFQVTLILIEVY